MSDMAFITLLGVIFILCMSNLGWSRLYNNEKIKRQEAESELDELYKLKNFNLNDLYFPDKYTYFSGTEHYDTINSCILHALKEIKKRSDLNGVTDVAHAVNNENICIIIYGTKNTKNDLWDLTIIISDRYHLLTLKNQKI